MNCKFCNKNHPNESGEPCCDDYSYAWKNTARITTGINRDYRATYTVPRKEQANVRS